MHQSKRDLLGIMLIRYTYENTVLINATNFVSLSHNSGTHQKRWHLKLKPQNMQQQMTQNETYQYLNISTKSWLYQQKMWRSSCAQFGTEEINDPFFYAEKPSNYDDFRHNIPQNSTGVHTSPNADSTDSTLHNSERSNKPQYFTSILAQYCKRSHGELCSNTMTTVETKLNSENSDFVDSKRTEMQLYRRNTLQT